MYQQQPPPQGMMGGYGYASDASYDSATYTGMSEQYINALAYGPFGRRSRSRGRQCRMHPLGVLATTGALCGLYLVYAARVNATLRRLQDRYGGALFMAAGSNAESAIAGMELGGGAFEGAEQQASTDDIDALERRRFLHLSPSPLPLEEQRERFMQLTKLSVFLNRTVVLPTLVMEQRLHPYDEFFDQERLCSKLPAGCVSQQQLDEEAERIRRVRRNSPVLSGSGAVVVFEADENFILMDRMPVDGGAMERQVTELMENGALIEKMGDHHWQERTRLVSLRGDRAIATHSQVRFHTAGMDALYKAQGVAAVVPSAKFRALSDQASMLLRKRFGIPSMALFHTLHMDFAETLASKRHIANFTEKLAKYVIRAEKDFGHMSPTYLSIGDQLCARKDMKPITDCEGLARAFGERLDVLTYRDIASDIPQIGIATFRPMIEENILIAGELFMGSDGTTLSEYVKSGREQLKRRSLTLVKFEALLT